ncbi:hypothetical protein FQR65_LT14315 [Abscondita terminalis]|nr:hypothetical protein FQR65_LT14315 [Abscondita terminalis]
MVRPIKYSKDPNQRMKWLEEIEQEQKANEWSEGSSEDEETDNVEKPIHDSDTEQKSDETLEEYNIEQESDRSELQNEAMGGEDKVRRDHIYDVLRAGIVRLRGSLTPDPADFQNVAYLKGITSNDIETVVKKAPKDLSQHEVDEIVIFYSRWLTFNKGPREFNFWLLALLMAVCKAGNCLDTYIDKKTERFNAIQKAPGVHRFLEQNLISTKILIKNLHKIVANTKDVTLHPLVEQAAFVNLTTVKVIGDTVSTLTDFLWAGLVARSAAIRSEFTILNELLEIYDRDKYVDHYDGGSTSPPPPPSPGGSPPGPRPKGPPDVTDRETEFEQYLLGPEEDDFQEQGSVSSKRGREEEMEVEPGTPSKKKGHAVATGADAQEVSLYIRHMRSATIVGFNSIDQPGHRSEELKAALGDSSDEEVFVPSDEDEFVPHNILTLVQSI